MKVANETKKVIQEKIVIEDNLDMAIILALLNTGIKLYQFSEVVKRELDELTGFENAPILEDTVQDKLKYLKKDLEEIL